MAKQLTAKNPKTGIIRGICRPIINIWQRENYGKIGFGKACAAIFGALLLSLCINLTLSIMLPIAVNNRLALASILTIPTWIGLGFACLISRNALVAWVRIIIVAILLAVVVVLFGI